MTNNYQIAIHGGAGNLTKEFAAIHQNEIKNALTTSLQTAQQILKNGGSAEEAVANAVSVLENDPVLNAGRGSVMNEDTGFELDASIMNGTNLTAGAIIGVNNCKNPIFLSRYIMNSTPHVAFTKAGATKLLKNSKLESVTDDYFYTELRYKQLQQAKKDNTTALDHNIPPDGKYGTVGAVALDSFGHLAAATSTGGMTNKMTGRVGDSPFIGCGTYANDKTCAISCTGKGEYFIRSVAAHDISALMEYAHKTLEEAMHIVLFEKIASLGGEGGIIGVDKDGNTSLLFNTTAMIRGFIDQNKQIKVSIFNEFI